MVVYLVHEYSDELHTTLGVFGSADKAISVARDVACMAGLLPQDEGGFVLAEYCDDNYDHVVWVEEAKVVE